MTCDRTTAKEAGESDAATQAPGQAVGIANAYNDVDQLGDDLPVKMITTPGRARRADTYNEGSTGD